MRDRDGAVICFGGSIRPEMDLQGVARHVGQGLMFTSVEGARGKVVEEPLFQLLDIGGGGGNGKGVRFGSGRGATWAAACRSISKVDWVIMKGSNARWWGGE